MLNDHIVTLLNRIVEKDFFSLNAKTQNDEDVFKCFNFENNPDSKMFIIYGDNSSGKSLIYKVIKQVLKTKSVASREANMSNRTSSGISRAFIYGDENEQSTGVTSFNVVKKCLEVTLKEKEKSAIAILDEPDLGLSPRYVKAFAQYITKTSDAMTSEQAVFVTSHNKDFIKAILRHSKSKPSFLGVNTSKSFQEFFNDDDEASLEELESLSSLGHERWVGISRHLKK